MRLHGLCMVSCLEVCSCRQISVARVVIFFRYVSPLSMTFVTLLSFVIFLSLEEFELL